MRRNEAGKGSARPSVRWREFGSQEALARTMRAALSGRDAKQAYQKLQTKGLKSSDVFWELVGMIEYLHSERAAQEPAWWKTTKTLASLPRDIRSMAGRMERLNADPRFSLDRQFVYLPATVLDKQLRDLPATLRQYAERLGGRLKFLRDARKRHARAGTQILGALSHLVLNETGKKRHADLAKILDAATKKSTRDPGYDFHAALKMLNRARLK
jgi:hypothetical protein